MRTLVDQQLQTNDCGISAVKTLCNLLEADIPREIIEQHIPLDQQGASFQSLHQFFERYGFQSQFHLIDVNAVDEEDANLQAWLPAIAPIKSKRGLHYVILKSWNGKQFTVFDPGKYRPYKLGLQAFRQKAYYSSSYLPLADMEDLLKVKIRKELKQFDIKMPPHLSRSELVQYFNKLSWFSWMRDNFPFRDIQTEQAFLRDLMFNQQMSALPEGFKSLKVRMEEVEIEAPILLSVKKPDQLVFNETEESENLYLKLFRSVSTIHGFWGVFLAITFLAATITYLAVFINQILIDHVLPAYQLNTLWLFAIGVGIFYFFDRVFSTFRRFFSIHLGNMFDKYFLSIFDHKLNLLSIQYLQSFRRGDLVERLSDSLKMKAFFMRFFSRIFVNAVVALFSIVILVAINWKLSMIVFLVLALFGVMFYIITPHLKQLEQKRFASKADFFSRFIEKIDGIQVLRSFGLEGFSSARIKSNFRELVEVRTRAKVLGLLNSTTASLITSLATLFIIVLASREMILFNTISLGMIITFVALSKKIFRAFQSLLDYNISLQEHEVILRRFFDFRQNIQLSAQIAEQHQIKDFKISQIAVRDLHFAYHDDRYVLKELDFSIRQGEKVWMQGRNGSGKSTLCKVLSFLYPPTKGEILINELPSGVFDEKKLRSKVAFVSGEDILFNDTLLFNITFEREVSLERLVQYAKMLNFYDFIDQQAEKFNFVLHENGKNLSTGQRRKVLLLRALMCDAQLVILDEIFNGMDVESIKDAGELLNCFEDKSFIVISHVAVEDILFDKRYKLKNGRLLEPTPQGVYHH